MNKILKAAVLGMGNMGRGHAENLINLTGVELVALCSDPVDDARIFADEKGLECKVYTDAYVMMDEVELDILYICLPPFAHNGQLEAAAKKGIHIFIEKPIAINTERGASMVAAVRQHRVCTQVGYHMRFGSAVERFLELMETGVTGRPTLYLASYECNSLHGPWWRDITKCGGQVFEQVIHLYDMALYLMGAAATVSGHVANLCHREVEGYTIEDTSISSIVFQNGALGSISGSNCAVKNRWAGHIRIVCEHMVADFEDHNHAIFTYTQDEKARTEVICEERNAMLAEDCWFIQTVRGGRPPVATIEEGFASLRLVSAVVESSGQEGQVVRL